MQQLKIEYYPPQKNPRNLIFNMISYYVEAIKQISLQHNEIQQSFKHLKDLQIDMQKSKGKFYDNSSCPEFQKFVNNTQCDNIALIIQEKIIKPNIEQLYNLAYNELQQIKAQVIKDFDQVNQCLHQDIQDDSYLMISNVFPRLEQYQLSLEKILHLICLIKGTKTDIEQYKKDNNTQQIDKYIDKKRLELDQLINSYRLQPVQTEK